jgi:hypothetical protein
MGDVMFRSIARFLFLLASVCAAVAHASDEKFSIAVIPDTQYLFDEDRYNPEVLTKTLQWIIEHQRDKNIVFTVASSSTAPTRIPPMAALISEPPTMRR